MWGGIPGRQGRHRRYSIVLDERVHLGDFRNLRVAVVVMRVERCRRRTLERLLELITNWASNFITSTKATDPW